MSRRCRVYKPRGAKPAIQGRASDRKLHPQVDAKRRPSPSARDPFRLWSLSAQVALPARGAAQPKPWQTGDAKRMGPPFFRAGKKIWYLKDQTSSWIQRQLET